MSSLQHTAHDSEITQLNCWQRTFALRETQLSRCAVGRWSRRVFGVAMASRKLPQEYTLHRKLCQVPRITPLSVPSVVTACAVLRHLKPRGRASAVQLETTWE